MSAYILPVLLAAALVPQISAGETALFVSPAGSDSNPGTTPERPFATLNKARDAARALKTEEPSTPIIIHLRGGVHRLDGPFTLTAADSGTATAPIRYQAFRDEKPLVSGGRVITGWRRGEQGVWTVTLPEVAGGKDKHSVYADPGFQAPQNGNFTLRVDSPAFGLGFQPIDIGATGPRPAE